MDCGIRNESSSSSTTTTTIEVNCLPGSNGGLPQHFLLEVRGANSGLLNHIPQSDQAKEISNDDTTISSNGPSVYQDRSDVPSFQLYGLLPGYEYTIAIYAENSRGRSEAVLIENVRIAEPFLLLGQTSRSRSSTETRFLGDLSGMILPGAASFQGAFVLLGLISEFFFFYIYFK